MACGFKSISLASAKSQLGFVFGSRDFGDVKIRDFVFMKSIF